MTVLYHYTNLTALTAILSEQSLKPSLRRHRRRDARYGDGLYLTDIFPGTLPNDQLSDLLVQNAAEADRFTHFLAIDVTGLEVIEGREHIFVVPRRKNLSLAGRIVRTGGNEDDLYKISLEP